VGREIVRGICPGECPALTEANPCRPTKRQLDRFSRFAIIRPRSQRQRQPTASAICRSDNNRDMRYDTIRCCVFNVQ